jgi:type II secretory pathway component PulL
MINLLPPSVKSGYRYGRRNVALRRWVILFVLAFIGLGGLATYGLLTLHQSTNNYNQQIASSEALFNKEKFSSVESQVQDISNSFRLVVQVLSKEVLFSELIKQIGVIMPDGANLSGLTISQLQGAIDITAVATNYDTASQVQVNLAAPANKLFSKADIVSITCDSNSASNPEYPCTVIVRAQFATNNPFLLINSKAATP